MAQDTPLDTARQSFYLGTLNLLIFVVGAQIIQNVSSEVIIRVFFFAIMKMAPVSSFLRFNIQNLSCKNNFFKINSIVFFVSFYQAYLMSFHWHELDIGINQIKAIILYLSFFFSFLFFAHQCISRFQLKQIFFKADKQMSVRCFYFHLCLNTEHKPKRQTCFVGYQMV